MLSRFSVTILVVSALCVVFMPFSSPAQAVTDSTLTAGSPELIHIWRDDCGVAHVVASSTAGAYWGFGYCLARDRLLQLELLRRSVQGTLAEILGKSFLEQDVLARRDGLSQTELQEGLDRADPLFRTALTSFARGINASIDAASRRRQLVHPAFRSLGLSFRPFTELDILEIFAGTMACRYNDFTQELDNLKLLNELVRRLGARSASRIFDDVIPFVDPGVYATLGRREHYMPALPGAVRFGPHPQDLPEGESPTLRQRKRNRELKTIGIPDKSGSYAAVLSLRGQGKPEALLLGGPQMGYFKPSAVYEIGLHTPDFDLVGATPVGYFVILFGANRHLGFTATAGVAMP
ncbi:MAG TPA: penicillin acylase family protein [Candidatus Ozemobacteraceae bacterium]|nr:penicillin acylase family protein [Candidatus Ozemobacteraceae bacterium]